MLIIMEEQCFNDTGNVNEKSPTSTMVLECSTPLLELQNKDDTSTVKRKRIKPIRIDSDESDCENSNAHVFCKTDSLVISASSQVTSVFTNENSSEKIKSANDVIVSENFKSNTHTPAVTNSEDKESKLADNLKSVGKKKLLFTNSDDSDGENQVVDLKSSDDPSKRLGVSFINSDDSDEELKSVSNLKDNDDTSNTGRKRFDLSAFADSDDSNNESKLVNNKTVRRRRIGLSAVIDSDDSSDEANTASSVKIVVNHRSRLSSFDSDDSNNENEKYNRNHSETDEKGEAVLNVNSVEEIDTVNEVRKKTNLDDNDLYSKDDSSCDEHSPAKEPENISPKMQKKKSKPSTTSSKDELKKIHSESQRILRESRLSLPYHRPKQHSLAEFLQRRRSSVASVKDVGTLWNHIKEREKEAIDFFKSDSENSDDEAVNNDNHEITTEKDDMNSELKENSQDKSEKCDSYSLCNIASEENVNQCISETAVSTNDLVCVLSEVSDSLNDPSCPYDCMSKNTKENPEKLGVENFCKIPESQKCIENLSTLTTQILPSDNTEKMDSDASVCSFGTFSKNSDIFTPSIDISGNTAQNLLSENTEKMDTDDFLTSFGKSTKNSDIFTLSIDSSCVSKSKSLNSSGLSKNNFEKLPTVIDLQDSEAVDIDFIESLKKKDEFISPLVDGESINSSFCCNENKISDKFSNGSQKNDDNVDGTIKFFENIKEKLDNVHIDNNIQSESNNRADHTFPSERTDIDDTPSNSRLTLSLKSLIPSKSNKTGSYNLLEKKLGKWGNYQDSDNEPENSVNNVTNIKNNDMFEDMSINFLVSAKVDSQDLCLDYTESEDINNTNTIDKSDLPKNEADVPLSQPDNSKKTDKQHILESDKTTECAEDFSELSKDTSDLQNSVDKKDESGKNIAGKEEYKLPFVPLSSDSETDETPKTKIKKLFKLDDKITKFTPRLSGAPESIIDLDETRKTRPKCGVENLISRFMKHVSSKKKPLPKETEISVISAEKGADDIEIVKKDIVKVTLGNESLVDGPDNCKPGYKHRRFREELRQQLALQRGQEWSKKLQEVKVDEEEIEKDDIYKEDKIEENTDESESEEEEEEEEDDIAITDKKREKNAYLDDEAEEEDDGDMADVSSDEEENESEEVFEKKKSQKLASVDTDVDEDESEEADNKEDESKRKNENDDSSAIGDEKSKPRFQRLKTLDDSDSDEDDAFSIPVYQPQGGCKNIELLVNASPNLMSPDVSMQSSLCKWPSSLKKTFESPSTTISGLSVSPKGSNMFLDKSQLLISPKKLFSDAPSGLDNANDFCLASKTNSDVDPEAELMELCSGNFETQLIVSEDVDKRDDKLSLQSYPESSEDLVKFGLSDDSASLGISKIFPSLLQINSEDLRKTQEQTKVRTPPRLVIDSDSDSEDQEKNNFKVKKKMNISKKLAFSDDEDTDDINSDLEDNESQTSVDDNAEKQEDVGLTNYDSEENEVEEAPAKPVDFFENEAELSESEWGSEDEDEKGLDSLESEAGDDEDLDQKQLKEQLDKIHMRRVLDDDKREVRLLQELLLEDGELHSEGWGRERKFRWKNTDTWEDNDKRNSGDESPGNNDEEEDEEEWRRMRREREKFFEEQKMNSQDPDTAEELVVEEEKAGKVLKLGMAAIRRSLSLSTQESVIEKQTMVLQRTNSEPVSSPQTKHPLNIRAQRGSFLARGESALARLAEISYGGPDSNLAGAKNSRNFVFAAVSPVKEVKVDKEPTEKLVVKRKLPIATPSITKKIKILDEKKMSRQRFFDSLLM